MFFGRKPNIHSNVIQSSEPIPKKPQKEVYEILQQKADAVRNCARNSSDKAAAKMVKRNKRKYPPAEYVIGEKVIVKNIYCGKKIKSKYEKTFKGIVKKKKDDRYQVEYEQNGKLKKAWYPVSLVTSWTRMIEKEKQAVKKEKQVKRLKSDFHLSLNDAVNEIENINHTDVTPDENERPKNYNFRNKRVSTYKDRNRQYNDDLNKAIKLSKQDTQHDTSYFKNVLAERGLRSVDVAGDGNCFFRAVAHQLFGDSSMYGEVRAKAVQEVVENPERYKEFILAKDIDDFTLALSTDREWADHLAIQAVANGFGVTIELINSNRRYGIRRILPTTTNTGRFIVLGHIEQIHFTSTEPDIPFETAEYGGQTEDTTLVNTCSIDGPLSWLMIAIESSPKLKNLVRNVSIFSDILKHFKDGKSAYGKLLWFQHVNENGCGGNGDFYGSEAKQFFEPLSKTNFARLNYRKSCNTKKCKDRTIERTYLHLPQCNTLTFKDKVKAAGKPIRESPCSNCGNHVIWNLENLPPFIFFPHDYITEGDNIPTVITINGLVYVLVLITMYDCIKKHFTAFFRFHPNYWIKYDGLMSYREKVFAVLALSFKEIQHLVFCKADLLNRNDFKEEIIELRSCGKSAGKSKYDSLM